MHYQYQNQSVQGEDYVLELHHATLQESESLLRKHKNDFSVSPPAQSIIQSSDCRHRVCNHCYSLLLGGCYIRLWKTYK